LSKNLYSLNLHYTQHSKMFRRLQFFIIKFWFDQKK
jgi:hypothetical protein